MGCRHSRPSDPSDPPPNPHLYYTHPNNPYHLISTLPFQPYADTPFYPSAPYTSHQTQTHPTFALPVSLPHSHHTVVRPPSPYPQDPPSTSSTHHGRSTHSAPSTHNPPSTQPSSTRPPSPPNPPSVHHSIGSSLTPPSYRSRNTTLPSYASNGVLPPYPCPYHIAPRVLVRTDAPTHCSTDPVIAGVVRPGTPVPDSSSPYDRHPARRYPAVRPVELIHPAPLRPTNTPPPEPAATSAAATSAAEAPAAEAPAPAPAPADVWAHYRASNLSGYAWLIQDPRYPATPPPPPTSSLQAPTSPPQPTSPTSPDQPPPSPTAISNDTYTAYRASNPVRYAPVVAAERRRRREWQVWRANRVSGGDGRWWF